MSPKQLTKEEEQRIYLVKTYIHNSLQNQFTIEQLAKKGALGVQKFTDGFYKIFKMSVGEYIHEARMQYAKFLLIKTEKSIKEIAQLCGYSKPSNFSTAYKKFFGLPPKNER